jgi:hypothetical protein
VAGIREPRADAGDELLLLAVVSEVCKPNGSEVSSAMHGVVRGRGRERGFCLLILCT